MSRTRMLLLAPALLGLALLACSDADPVAPGERPNGHTILIEGHWHAPGLCEPYQNCIACHGEDLNGGASGTPACFQCHGAEWNDDCAR